MHAPYGTDCEALLFIIIRLRDRIDILIYMILHNRIINRAYSYIDLILILQLQRVMSFVASGAF